MASAELLRLQNQLKRSPESFVEEFEQQRRHFESTLQVFRLQSQENNSSKISQEFAVLVNFMCHAVPYYKDTASHIPQELLLLLENKWENLEPHLRKTIVQGLIQLQNRSLIERIKVLPVFFTLFRAKDKQLRKLLFSHIVNDIKNVNKNKRQNKLNSTLQTFISGMIKDDDTTAAKKSLDVMVELWRRKVWDNDKTVLAISQACFHKEMKIQAAALRFFLGVGFEDDDDDEDAETVDNNSSKVSKAMKEVMANHRVMPFCKSKKKRTRELKRALHVIKQGKQSTKGDTLMSANAIQLLNDPQQIAERLFSQLKKSSNPFDNRLLQMNVLSRIIGQHKLLLFNFYPFLQKYIQPHQKDVTHILSYLAQASHKLVDPDALAPCIKALANTFVTDRSSPEVMAVGLNAIREVCLRCPLVMEQDLLQDLTQYKKEKQKGVMMAARSLIALFRKLNPDMLIKKDRGKEAALLTNSGEQFEGQLEYGAQEMFSDVVGADLLARLEAEDEGLQVEKDDDDEWKVQEAGSSSDDDDDAIDAADFFGGDAAGEIIDDGDEDSDEGDGDEGDGDEEDGINEDPSAVSAVSEPEPEPVAKPVKHIASIRILTPKDFQRIKELRAKQRQDVVTGKRKREDGETTLKEAADEVDPEDLVGYTKKKRLTKEERMDSIYEGREGRVKFGAPKDRMGGTTNQEKMRTKNFLMVKNSKRIQGKKAGTMFDKAQKNSKHIKGLKNMQKNSKRKLRKRK